MTKITIKGQTYAVTTPDLVVKYWYPAAAYVISDNDGWIVVVRETDEKATKREHSRFYQIDGKNYKELYCGSYEKLTKKMSRNKQYVQLSLF